MRSQEALILAQQQAHPFSLVSTLAFTAFLQQSRRDKQAAQVQAEATIGLATEQGFAFRRASSIIVQGWALTVQGQVKEGISQIRQGLAAYRATGAEVGCTYYLALLVEAYGHSGQGETGLRVLVEALAVAQKTGERFYEAELYRLQGELLLTRSTHQTAEAEACFHQTLGVARHQQAKSLELRAAMSLSRLWQRQGKRDEARQLLADTYGWFTEGFDTADLQEAKVLLEELA